MSFEEFKINLEEDEDEFINAFPSLSYLEFTKNQRKRLLITCKDNAKLQEAIDKVRKKYLGSGCIHPNPSDGLNDLEDELGLTTN